MTLSFEYAPKMDKWELLPDCLRMGNNKTRWDYLILFDDYEHSKDICLMNIKIIRSVVNSNIVMFEAETNYQAGILHNHKPLEAKALFHVTVRAGVMHDLLVKQRAIEDGHNFVSTIFDHHHATPNQMLPMIERAIQGYKNAPR